MFKVIGFVLKFYPYIMIGVGVIEAILDDRPGAEKKAALMSALRTLAGRLGISIDARRAELLENAIDLIVSVFNVTGLFAKHEQVIEDVQAVVTEAAHAAAEEAAVARDSRLDELEAQLSR